MELKETNHLLSKLEIEKLKPTERNNNTTGKKKQNFKRNSKQG